MNENENKAVELKDPQLEQVSGGESIEAPGTSIGDPYGSMPSCFELTTISSGITPVADCSACSWYSGCTNYKKKRKK